MNPGSLVGQLVDTFKAQGRVVIVGASLAGLRAAEALRDRGFAGHLTIIGDEQYEPYDRPPLSKQVLKGWVPAHHTKLPRLRPVDAQWRLGVAAVGLDRSTRQVLLANGERVEYDRLLIATGTRARPWFNPQEAALEGLFTVRTCDDAEKLAAALKRRPRRVLIVGSGFGGSEIASVCRDLDLPVTVAERGKAPLVGALGGVIGDELASAYADAIQTHDPEGPYQLLGWSFGGATAHQVAVELQQRGAVVVRLIALDPILIRDASTATVVSESDVLEAILQAVGVAAEQYCRPLTYSQAQTLIQQEVDAEFALPSRRLVQIMVANANTNLQLNAQHQPGIFAGRMVLFSAQPVRSGADLQQCWRQYVAGEVTEYPVNCTHEELLNPAALKTFGDLIRAALDQP